MFYLFLYRSNIEPRPCFQHPRFGSQGKFTLGVWLLKRDVTGHDFEYMLSQNALSSRPVQTSLVRCVLPLLNATGWCLATLSRRQEELSVAKTHTAGGEEHAIPLL